MRHLTRRFALLGATGLLAACDTFSDAADSIFGESKVRLPGERRTVLSVDRPLEVDEGPRLPVTLPAATDRTDWPQAGGGLGHAPGNPALGSPLGEAWRSSIGNGSAYRRRLTSPPVSDGKTIFTIDAEGEAAATDAATGRRLWRFDTTPKEDSDGQLGGGITLGEGSLFVTTGLAEAMALNPVDGKVTWRVKLPAPARGAPTVANGRLFVPTIANQLVALKVADGEKLWTHQGLQVTTMALGLPAPAVEGDTVVAGLASGEIVGLRASDGRQQWNDTLGGGGGRRGSTLAEIAGVSGLPVIDRGRVYVTAMGGATVALDLRTGRRLWERDIASPETPWVVGDWIFLLTASMELVCLGRNDGRVRWVRALPRWKDEAKSRDAITWGGPVVAGGRVIITSNTAEMLELKPEDGEPISRIRLPGPTLLAPAVFGGTLYLLTEEGDLVAIRGR